MLRESITDKRAIEKPVVHAQLVHKLFDITSQRILLLLEDGEMWVLNCASLLPLRRLHLGNTDCNLMICEVCALGSYSRIRQVSVQYDEFRGELCLLSQQSLTKIKLPSRDQSKVG